MQLFGRIYDPIETAKYVASLPTPNAKNIPRLMVKAERQATHLWKPLIQVQPSWRRGQQEIGDCVSWGAEFAATLLLAKQAVQGRTTWRGPAATETIYGGCRVEIAGGEMGRQDGAMGHWAADWLKKYGVLLREDYSKITGNPDHDMREYSGRKASNFGYYGNGGKDDEGKLDAIAKEHPIKEVTQVTDFDDLVELLLRGCPVTCASGVGYEGNRNSEGIISARGQWPHQMCFIGVDFSPGGEAFVICGNSWGRSPVSGPFPGVEEEAIHLCAWRCKQRDVERQLQEQDCFAFSDVDWNDIKPFNFTENLIV